MRIFTGAYLALFVTVTALSAQSEVQDPYWTNLVSVELKMNTDTQRVITSWGQKDLARLGDRVSVSILKILEPAEIKNPQKVKSCLLIIREAFAQPQFISLELDKNPKVTLFLIDFWKQNVADQGVQQDIRETLEVIKEKTGR